MHLKQAAEYESGVKNMRHDMDNETGIVRTSRVSPRAQLTEFTVR